MGGRWTYHITAAGVLVLAASSHRRSHAAPAVPLRCPDRNRNKQPLAVVGLLQLVDTRFKQMAIAQIE
jgi:hypothetical protein